MKRLLLVPFLALALVLAACGGSDVQEPGDGSAAATTAAGTNLVVTVWADPATSADPTVTTVDGDAGGGDRQGLRGARSQPGMHDDLRRAG